jgi:hypothetical protein
MAGDIVSEIVVGLKEAWHEAQAERIRRTTPVAYWCHLIDDFSYASREFYALVERHLQERAVPDLLTDYILLREGTVFSKQRQYLELRRERFVFQICAAPFGTGWFVSSRLFDRRRGARWLDFILVGLLLLWVSVGLWAAFDCLVAAAVLGTIVTLLWSLMRLAASESAARLDDQLCQLPCVGRIYETLFHPDTYFRQDQRNMYREAVHRAVMAALGDLHAQKGLKQLSEAESQPVLTELQRR